MRILFVHNALRSFVRIDRDLLAEQHQVDELDLSVPARVFSLPVKVARADMVFAWFASLHSLGPVVLAQLLRKPAIVVVGGYDTAAMPEIGYGHMAHPWKRHIVRWMCNHASALIANSETAATEVRRNTGTSTPVHAIAHGFPPPGAALEEGRRRLVLSVGNVNRSNLKRKGHEVFVRAAALLPDARFVLAGEDAGDGAAQWLQDTATSNVVLAGRVSQEKLDRLFQRAAVYVQVSAHEAFGCALVEAMRCGCIPVVSRRGALPEVAGRQAVYVDESDAEDVARGIRLALGASEDWRAAVRREAIERYPLERRRDRLLQLVAETAGASSRRGSRIPRRAREARRLPPLDPCRTRVAVVVPVRNEESHIGATLRSILRQTFPAERLQIIVADGQSSDNTPRILADFATHNDRVLVLENARRSAPSALNLGIRATDAEVIVRVDGHCEIAPDYVEQCVATLARTGAANVGGPMRPRGQGAVGAAVAMATRSRFGVGNARFHYLGREAEVDTVYLGAFRREVLEEVGSFDEELVRNQDDELNHRIRMAGYAIVLSPDIISHYTPRSSLSSLWRQYAQYGFWKVRVIQKHPGSLQPRHLAPPILAGALGCSALAYALTGARRFLAPVGGYAAGLVVAAVWTGRKRPAVIPPLLAVFACIHLAYGSGFLLGLLRAALVRRGRE